MRLGAGKLALSLVPVLVQFRILLLRFIQLETRTHKGLNYKSQHGQGRGRGWAEPVGGGCQGYHRLIVIDWMKILSEKFKMKGEKNSHVIKIKSLLWLSSEYGKDFYGYLLFEPAEIKQTYRKNKTTTTFVYEFSAFRFKFPLIFSVNSATVKMLNKNKKISNENYRFWIADCLLPCTERNS